ncbi:alpha/beta hydrolase [Robiginitalea sp. M366]|uniref:alpha/beta hydrolase n=1 Tax=Robiginitalea aestuariiviva TaxID=3036903 RepID=UPI00240D8FE3|nr:alpha/beta hydrolase [Robiginitalea aestuariiviva]MDG1572374.1 alpha/beta hydrolase [Robiginitalea aestuariiviva]
MKRMNFLAGCALLILWQAPAQTDSIPLPFDPLAGVVWSGGEHHYYSPIWDTQVVTNVSRPSMEVFTPVAGTGNQAAVVVAPGGGLFGLSIESEGKQVARWLAQHGFTAFVLKYRLVPTGVDGVKEIMDLSQKDPGEMMARVGKVLPASVADGLQAMAYVRAHAGTYGLDPDKIGFMGFSAGGAVTMGVGYQGQGDSAPDFLVPVYPWTDAYPVAPAPEGAPPMLVICASDDPLGLAAGSTRLYSAWLEAGKTAALQMYSKGGHGFGMKPQGLPSDHWIERFYDWAKVHILVP